MNAPANIDLLAQLMRQAVDGDGGRGTDLTTLRAIAEEAGELGASRALTRCGLSDEAAHGDLKELRELLEAWRDAKRSALKAAIGWVIRMMLALVLVGMAVRTGLGGWVK